MTGSTVFDVMIVGDGFCSLSTAAHCVQESGKKARIAVIGRKERWGAGLAYGLCADYHLLNVPAGRMGAYAEKPQHFLDWAVRTIPPDEQKPFIQTSQGLEGAFVPRAWYKAYLQALADQVFNDARSKNIQIEFFDTQADHLDYEDSLLKIRCGQQVIDARYVVLATGVPPLVSKKDDPKAWMVSAFDRSEPFNFSTLENETRPVVILGLGLTMIDIIMSLSHHNYRGKIYAFSRRGLLPLAHATQENPSAIDHILRKLDPLDGRLSIKMRTLRKNALLCEKSGMAWPHYIDIVRAQVPTLWSELSVREQSIFLRHALPYWNIHRHRQPQKSKSLLDEMIKRGQLTVSKQPIKWQQNGDALEISLADGSKINDIAHVFNARGPDYRISRNSFLQSALDAQLIEAHPSGLGIITDHTHSAQGKAAGALFATGSLMIGMYLDSTSVPELRAQCQTIARALVS